MRTSLDGGIAASRSRLASRVRTAAGAGSVGARGDSGAGAVYVASVELVGAGSLATVLLWRSLSWTGACVGVVEDIVIDVVVMVWILVSTFKSSSKFLSVLFVYLKVLFVKMVVVWDEEKYIACDLSSVQIEVCVSCS
jgi:hypothetical protein